MNRSIMPIVGAAAGLAVMASASQASAQLGTGQSGTSTTMYVQEEQAWRALTNFGNCYALRRTPQALELVSTRAGSIEEARTYKRLFRSGDGCLTLVDEMTVNFLMVRGAIAEGLYRQSIPVPVALAVASAPSAAQVTSFADAALCFAASNRGPVQDLIAKTKAGSRAENKALDVLLPGIISCIPENARTINVGSTLIRFRLAEALWRLGFKPDASADAG